MRLRLLVLLRKNVRNDGQFFVADNQLFYHSKLFFCFFLFVIIRVKFYKPIPIENPILICGNIFFNVTLTDESEVSVNFAFFPKLPK